MEGVQKCRKGGWVEGMGVGRGGSDGRDAGMGGEGRERVERWKKKVEGGEAEEHRCRNIFFSSLE